MVQSPSWEADWFAASQEIPRISRNPKVHYRTHKRPPPISILGPSNPVHIYRYTSGYYIVNWGLVAVSGFDQDFVANADRLL